MMYISDSGLLSVNTQHLMMVKRNSYSYELHFVDGSVQSVGYPVGEAFIESMKNENTCACKSACDKS